MRGLSRLPRAAIKNAKMMIDGDAEAKGEVACYQGPFQAPRVEVQPARSCACMPHGCRPRDDDVPRRGT